MTAKRQDSEPIRASGLIPRGDTAHRFKTKFAASVSFQTACAGLLRHSRAGGNPNTNAPLTPPTAEFVIPTQAGIQASNFQKRLESVAQSNSRLRGRLASADGNTERPYPMDYIFRRPPQSSRHYNQHTNNQYGIGHLPPSACAGLLRHSRTGGNPNTNAPLTPPTAEFVIPAQAGIQASDFQKRLESVAQSNSPPARQACVN